MKHIQLLLFILLFTGSSFGQWVSTPAINNTVANTAGQDLEPFSVTDGTGGSLIFFNSGAGNDLYAQRITVDGMIAWGTTSNPVVICNAPNGQYSYKAIPDGTGGAYVAWEDRRDGSAFEGVYIQHINNAGTLLWPVNGQRVSSNLFRDDYGPSLCSDGNGGVIIAWTGDDLQANVQVYAQRFNSAGIAQWTADGVQACTAPGFRGGAIVVADNNNGAMLFFTDTRNDPMGLNYDSLVANDLANADIYAQRLSGGGAPLWTNNGVALCTALGNQDAFENSQVVADGSGGAVMAFIDGRNDPFGNYENMDIFTQRVNSSGAAQWPANGVAVCTSPGNQYGVNNCLVPDGTGGMVATWADEDSARVFVQKINGAGIPSWTINGVAISPGGFGTWAFDPVLVNDSAGNYIVAYKEDYASFNGAIKAQKLNSSGSKLWNPTGVIVSEVQEGFGNACSPRAVLSDSGSVIASWSDRHANLATQDIYASKLLSTGVLAGVPAGYITIANGNWNNSSIWMGGQVPSPGISAIVRHQVTVTANALCWSLKVEQPNGSVTVKAGVTLTIEH
ncbi:MAG: hypothetical protein V4722_01700 [Bacteroidota bacterium]